MTGVLSALTCDLFSRFYYAIADFSRSSVLLNKETSGSFAKRPIILHVMKTYYSILLVMSCKERG